ncbi:MAG: cytochrome [Bacteroidota bacterium]
MRKKIIGVFGAGEGADEQSTREAFALGKLIADNGWVVLTGGRDVGVMRAACEGAKQVPGSITVGILPDDEPIGVSPFVDIPILTGMGNARNNINVLSCDVAVAVGNCGAGTVSEIALAAKAGKPLLLLHIPNDVATLALRLSSQNVYTATSPIQAVEILKQLLNE